MPSRRVSISYPQATRKRLPPPARIPITDSSGVLTGRALKTSCGGAISSQGTKLAASPTPIPGRLMTSGMMRWSMSMKVITRKAAMRANMSSPSHPGPNRVTAMAANPPLRSSTSG